MNLNQTLSINPNNCAWVFLHSSLHALALLTMLLHNVTIHNEGVYISFPSCSLKLSNLHIQFYLLALTTINAFYLLRMRANRSRSVYIIQVHFIKFPHLCSRIKSKRNSKIVLALVQLTDCLHAGSLDVRDAPASKCMEITTLCAFLGLISRFPFTNTPSYNAWKSTNTPSCNTWKLALCVPF
jgi:hypothetical protein